MNHDSTTLLFNADPEPWVFRTRYLPDTIGVPSYALTACL